MSSGHANKKGGSTSIKPNTNANDILEDGSNADSVAEVNTINDASQSPRLDEAMPNTEATKRPNQ